jgi:hypothetical protein
MPLCCVIRAPNRTAPIQAKIAKVWPFKGSDALALSCKAKGTTTKAPKPNRKAVKVNSSNWLSPIKTNFWTTKVDPQIIAARSSKKLA